MKTMKDLIIVTLFLLLIFSLALSKSYYLLYFFLLISITYKLYWVIRQYFYYKKAFIQLKKNFVDILNHNLKVSTLAQIRGLEQLSKKSISEENRELLESISESCEYTYDMIATLIDTYKLEAERENFYYEKCSPKEILDQARNNNKFFVQKKLKLRFYTNTDKIFNVDKKAILKVFETIFEFASQYSYKNSLIVVFVRDKNGSVEFNIAFNGDNLKPNVCEQFFNSSYRFATVGECIKLQMCRNIIEAHGGKIRVISKGNNINYFTFAIPVMQNNILAENLITQMI